MRPIKLLASVFILYLIAGCASVPQSAENSVYAAHVAYDAALSGALFYKDLPVCPAKPLCKDPLVLQTIQTADKAAFDALTLAQKIVRAKTSGQAALQSAVTWATEAIAAFGKVVTVIRSGS